MTTLKAIAAEYNELAARLGERPVNRFPDRATAEKRLATIRASWRAVAKASASLTPKYLSVCAVFAWTKSTATVATSRVFL
jgi:hypothetical protein